MTEPIAQVSASRHYLCLWILFPFLLLSERCPWQLQSKSKPANPLSYCADWVFEEETWRHPGRSGWFMMEIRPTGLPLHPKNIRARTHTHTHTHIDVLNSFLNLNRHLQLCKSLLVQVACAKLAAAKTNSRFLHIKAMLSQTLRPFIPVQLETSICPV